MSTLNRTLWLLVALLVNGCSHLKEVQDFSKESARFASYTKLTERYRTTYQREAPYLYGKSLVIAKDNDQRRQEEYLDLLKVHHRVTLYMQTLAKLSGDETFDLSKNVDSLGGTIKPNPKIGLTDKQVSAYSGLSKTIAKWVTAGPQESAVKAMITEGDPDLQALLTGMSNIIKFYKATSDNEKRTVLGLYESEIPFYEKKRVLLLVSLGKDDYTHKILAYAALDGVFEKVQRGLTEIQAGHSQLAQHVNELSNSELRAIMEQIAKDLRSITSYLNSLRS
ncbi:MAG: hypothetical protein JWP80_404 [Pseudomonas sp.]|nr:hypothetical protein [Pseudomonas sp.]